MTLFLYSFVAFSIQFCKSTHYKMSGLVEMMGKPLLDGQAWSTGWALLIATIVLIVILAAFGLYSSKKSGFSTQPDAGVLLSNPGQFSRNWGTPNWYQGSVSTAQPIGMDSLTVYQDAFKRYPADSEKNMKMCGAGEYYVEFNGVRADTGADYVFGACFPDGKTILNPKMSGFKAAPKAASRSGGAKSPAKADARKKAHFTSGPGGFQGYGVTPEMCNEMWSIDAEAELFSQVKMTNAGATDGPDDVKLNTEIADLE